MVAGTEATVPLIPDRTPERFDCTPLTWVLAVLTRLDRPALPWAEADDRTPLMVFCRFARAAVIWSWAPSMAELTASWAESTAAVALAWAVVRAACAWVGSRFGASRAAEAM